mmetsp:Transcript_13948/g.20604  ORF Transcript_13948/g.20604 Transcript_13948/m.20604 type:complete len:266 (+) Transcript_13948:87-884(+)|eukprot:CAMPEP_0194202666 /NCGR_PEP_ID=MMETSP0156-20130528/2637_1 /TAXON_ID=33649 /ORGANISM="Thalassionema nitzschioides, Strain L26-B" /LENGTH=265 /DNA_ID=CAMNT_0038928227 /DNA_START=34 /DNA_END=831 /DNA_ORIENTATION=-
MKLSVALSILAISPVAAWHMSADVPSGKSRRDIISKGVAFAAAVPTIANAYTVPDLPYAFDALEPYIDAPTMKIHHDKHHATYVANINKATEGKPEVPILDLMADALDAGAARNSGGGHYNHAFFWELMEAPDKAKNSKLSAQLEELINKSFGSMDEMKSQFEAKAAPGATFGSGWVWVVVNQKGDALSIVNTPNQDNPLMKGVLSEGIMLPILGIDVWEHAYYLKYQNRRPEYVSNWWNVVNWDKVSENCAYVVENHVGVSVKG